MSDATSPSRGRVGWVRTLAAALCGVLAVLLVAEAAVAAWARATIYDEATVIAITRDALADEEVREALAERLADSVVAHFALGDDLAAALPPSLDRLRPFVSPMVERAVEQAFVTILARPATTELATRLAARSHSVFLDVVEGRGLAAGLRLEDGEVSMNFLPLITIALGELEKQGLPIASRLPSLTVDGDTAEQIAALSAATQRQLPGDFGQLVLYRNDELTGAPATITVTRRLLVAARRANAQIFAAAIVSTVAAVAIARDRAGAVLRLAVGFTAAMALLRSAIAVLRESLPALTFSRLGRRAIEVVGARLADGLARTTGIVMLVTVGLGVAMLAHRRWQRADLWFAAAAVLGTTTVIIGGFNLPTLVTAGIVTAATFMAQWHHGDGRHGGRAGELPPPGKRGTVLADTIPFDASSAAGR